MLTATIICSPRLAPDWQPQSALTIPQNQVGVFRLPTPSNETDLARWQALITGPEQERANRFRQAADRNRFIAGRGLFRLIGSRITGQTPQSVSIRTSTFGKPFLTDAPDWHLSVSHSGDWIVLAVAQIPVGIDVEWINRRFAINDLVPVVLMHSEQQLFAIHPDQELFFYECWTRKEAIVKATGVGMTDDLLNVPALEGTHTVDPEWIGSAGNWQVQPFFVDDAYPAAVATVYMNKATSFGFYDVGGDSEVVKLVK